MTAISLTALKPWLEAQPFFVLGSASAAGDCDSSYRGRKTGAEAEPLLLVDSDTQLVFPDYPGNNLFNTLGNLIEHPQLSLLLVDFAQQCTVLLQGSALLAGPDPRWPSASRTIVMQVAQVLRSPVAGLPQLVPA